MPETTLQPAAGIETFIDENTPTTNYGTDTDIRVQLYSDGDNRDALIKFDLTSIVQGSKIQAATLSLWKEGQGGGGADILGDVIASRILPANEDWTEGGATWNKYDGSNDWAGSVGCETIGTDIAAAEMARGKALWGLGEADGAFYDIPLTVSEVQAWIDVANTGLKIWSEVRSPSVNRHIEWSSSDHATAAQHPKLYVRWIEPSGIIYEYRFNKYDPLKRIYDGKGEEIQPSQVRANKWIFVEGFDIPSSKVYSSLVEDPRASYIKGVSYDEERGSLAIETDRNQFADAIIQRLSRGV